MKTKFMLAAALLFSAGTYAQTIQSSGEQSSAVQAGKTTELNMAGSSNTSVHSEAGAATAKKINQEKQQVKEEAKTETKAAKYRVNETAATVAKEKNSASVSVSGEGVANASAKDNKLNQDASLQGGASLSAGAIENTARYGGAAVKPVAKTAVKTAAVTAVHAKATVAKTVQPRPATVKMQTRVQAHGGIKIK